MGTLNPGRHDPEIEVFKTTWPHTPSKDKA